jgi:hypothetical protein
MQYNIGIITRDIEIRCLYLLIHSGNQFIFRQSICIYFFTTFEWSQILHVHYTCRLTYKNSMQVGAQEDRTKWEGGVRIWSGRDKRFFSTPQSPGRLWGPLSLLSNGYRGALFPGVKRLGREADHSPPSSSEVKNGGAVPPLPYLSS